MTDNTIILLHGATSVKEVWKPVLQRLERRYPEANIVALALPGHLGGSELIAPCVTVEAMAEQIRHELHSQGIESAHVVGNSLGGWLAVELARLGFAKSVLALSPAGGWVNEASLQKVARIMALACKLMPYLKPILSPLMGFEIFRKLMFSGTMKYPERVNADEARHYLKGISACPAVPALLANFQGDAGIKPLADRGIPIRILWSENDNVIPYEEYSIGYRRNVLGAEFLTLADAGHVPMYDQPDAIVGHIEQMLLPERCYDGIPRA